MRSLSILFAISIVLPSVALAESDRHALRARIEELVRENFYDANRAQSFAIPETASTADGSFDTVVSQALAGLGVSHTGRYTPDRIDYFELLDIYRFAVPDGITRLFPPAGEVTYPGIGLIAEEINGGVFAVDVYHGGPAARAGVREGDEILSVDGASYSEISSFQGKAGMPVILRIRRQADATPLELRVEVEAIRPNAMFTQSISDSIRIVERNDHDIGYVRLWSFTSEETMQLFEEELATGRLARADALVLDLRSRWGGAPLDLAEIFVGGSPSMEYRDRQGNRYPAQVRWRKPVVAIIDEGTRSGLEALAYALKINGVPLIGAHTARAVIGGTAFMLPDDSLLMLAVRDAVTGGIRLEEIGVAPDIVVERDVRYEGGADPQIEAALNAATARL